jgi:hypothetical protein
VPLFVSDSPDSTRTELTMAIVQQIPTSRSFLLDVRAQRAPFSCFAQFNTALVHVSLPDLTMAVFNTFQHREASL